MNNIKNLTNDQLYKEYQIARNNLLNAVEGTKEEIEADNIFTELAKEINSRNIDLKSYKLAEQEETKIKPNTIKKSIKTIVSTLLIVGTLISASPIQAYAKDINTNTLEVTNTYTKATGGRIQEYNNNSWTYINSDTNKYVFQIDELGDWDFSCNNQQELDNLIAEYKSHIEDPNDLVNVIKDVKPISNYKKLNGSIVTEYNNGSWSLINKDTNTYIFTPAETSDFEMIFNNETELNNCIETYKSIKLNGCY